MDADFVLGALEQAIWTRKHRDGGDPWGLVHHSDHGSQYLSIAYTGRLVDEGTGRLGRSRGLLPAQTPPPNTATIETTPPRYPPQHNQPPTKPRTIL